MGRGKALISRAKKAVEVEDLSRSGSTGFEAEGRDQGADEHFALRGVVFAGHFLSLLFQQRLGFLKVQELSLRGSMLQQVRAQPHVYARVLPCPFRQ